MNTVLMLEMSVKRVLGVIHLGLLKWQSEIATVSGRFVSKQGQGAASTVGLTHENRKHPSILYLRVNLRVNLRAPQYAWRLLFSRRILEMEIPP